ncbi:MULTISPECIES: AAA family ATPase [Citricoccus]|uniref:AAA family ATPase n=1 Tax=Citricoccus TaxID=169133 RepID=UPI000255F0A5|nr:SMC family ATPase [Citricoccus sp. CH26A]
MRIHCLQLQAFGPFAEREEVDFSILNDAGLFLLDGPTGAGKSTVLAGICFALYGSVPGDRTPESLASTQAPIGTRPEVLLDFTVGGRRFEVQRWPRYRRPARRKLKDGTGLTEEKAGAVLREHREGQWREVSVRADEIGQLLGQVLHLDADQFMRVVLLPQGEFATFLRARSADKETLLRKLFGTGRFDGVEDFLARRYRHLESAVSRDRDQVATARADLISCLTEGLGDDWWARGDDGPGRDDEAVREDGEGAGLTVPVTGPDSGGACRPQDWTDEDLGTRGAAAIDAAVAGSRAARQQAAAALTAAQEHLEALTRRRQDLRQALAWQGRSVRHAERAGQVSEDRAALERHGVAVTVDRRAREAEAAEEAHRSAVLTLEGARATALEDTHCRAWAAEAADGAEEDRFEVLRQRADRELDRLSARERDAESLRDLDAEVERLQSSISALTERAETADAERRALAEAREALQQRVEDLGAPAAGLESARAVMDEATARREASLAHQEHRAALQAAQDAVRDATDRAQEAVDAWHRVVERRLAGAASLLAEELRAGEPCQVCGSVEHPAPAATGGIEISTEAQDRARRAMDEETASRRAAEDAVERARESAELSRLAAGGLDPEEATVAVARAGSALDAAERAADDLAAARAALEDNDREHQSRQAIVGAARQEAAVARSRCEAASQEAGRLRSELAGLLEDRQSLAELRQELTRSRGLVDAVTEAARRAATTRSLLDQAATGLREELTASGFDSVEQVRAALLGEEDEQSRSIRVRDWDREAAALAELEASATVVRGRELLAAGTETPADEEVEEQAGRVAEAERAREDAAERAGGLESVQRQVRRQVGALDEVAARSAGQLAALEDAEGLLRLVRGQGENTLRMTLGSYVLAGRLEEVVASATERLLGMTQGRYELRHDDAARGRGVRGLDITVFDRYTEDERAAGTLSGGETFMASLALALGLADTVQAEAGGVEMDTLFVDEGFGSLDTASLEDVMRVLDGLQAGGRAIGVVSHVERMKQDIGYRLEVLKTRRGSHLRVVVPEQS